MKRLKKNIFLGIFAATVGILGITKMIVNPRISDKETVLSEKKDTTDTAKQDTVLKEIAKPDSAQIKVASIPYSAAKRERKAASSDTAKFIPHRILSVHSYKDCFPDVQDVQIVSAKKWGVPPVRNRKQAEERKSELVYVGANPYFKIDTRMKSSIPYLIPRAADLLQTISRNYLDSLWIKGVPMHKLIITSVLRTDEDIAKLRSHNGNAVPQSCHRYGTTFDICYNRYETVSPPGEERRAVQNDTLKWVLSEVLRDIREEGLCHIKYEVKQGCFHITVK